MKCIEVFPQGADTVNLMDTNLPINNCAHGST